MGNSVSVVALSVLWSSLVYAWPQLAAATEPTDVRIEAAFNLLFDAVESRETGYSTKPKLWRAGAVGLAMSVSTAAIERAAVGSGCSSRERAGLTRN